MITLTNQIMVEGALSSMNGADDRVALVEFTVASEIIQLKNSRFSGDGGKPSDDRPENGRMNSCLQ